MRFRVKKMRKLGHVNFNGHFARNKLQLEMAPFYNSSQSKKLQPNMSLDERLGICARALLNNLLKSVNKRNFEINFVVV